MAGGNMTTIGDQVTCAMCQQQCVPGSTVRVYDQGEHHYCPTCWSGQKESRDARVSREFREFKWKLLTIYKLVPKEVVWIILAFLAFTVIGIFKLLLEELWN